MSNARPGLTRIASRALIAQPFMFAAAFVLQRFAETNATDSELWRPLFAIELGTALIFLGVWAAVRRRQAAVLVTTIGVGIAASYTIPALVLASVYFWWWMLKLLRAIRGQDIGPIVTLPGRFALGLSSGLLVIALISTASASWVRINDRAALPMQSSGIGGPNVYLLLLDGYPRADSLEDEFGIDNSPFLDQLGALDFDVAGKAHSNYNKTWLTVASLVDARYVHDLPSIKAATTEGAPAQIRLLHEIIDRGAALDVFRARSYQITSVHSPVTTTDVLADAQVRSSGHLTAFEISLLAHSLVARLAPAPFLEWITADQRSNLFAQLAIVKQISSEAADQPRLVLAHLMSPHLPFLLGQDPNYLDGCFPYCEFWTTPQESLDITDAEYASRLGTQIQVLNEAVINAVHQIVEADPSAWVIVMSDHGIRQHVRSWSEHFRTLFAARTPGYEEVFPDDISPVNVFRRAFTELFDGGLPDLPYEAWRSDWNLPLVLTRQK